MSGGHFNYNQTYISEIANEILSQVRNNMYPLPEEGKFSDNVVGEFREAYKILAKGAIYAQRIDWLLSGDDGEESFFSRLIEELAELDKEFLTNELLKTPKKDD